VVRLVSQDGERARTAVFWYSQGMNDIAETKRLAEASERKIKELPALAADPVPTKKELAARLRIGMRTVDTWMKRRRIPYIEIGKAVRLRWSEVERCLEMLEKRPGWCV
jgi:excisionase family DNA binding protein